MSHVSDISYMRVNSFVFNIHVLNMTQLINALGRKTLV